MKKDEEQEFEYRAQIVQNCRQLEALGLTFGTAGNISIRYIDGALISPSGIRYENLNTGNIVKIKQDGSFLGNNRPSTEWRMHIDIYQCVQAAQAVVHTHSPYATALSCQRKPIPAFHYMVAIAGGNSIRCAKYAVFGSEALSNNMLEALRDRSACLLANHGVIAYGRNIDEAMWRAGEVEMLARQYILSVGCGEPVLLSKAEMRDVIDRFSDYDRNKDK